jgi:hypothetical protein
MIIIDTSKMEKQIEIIENKIKKYIKKKADFEEIWDEFKYEANDEELYYEYNIAEDDIKTSVTDNIQREINKLEDELSIINKELLESKKHNLKRKKFEDSINELMRILYVV